MKSITILRFILAIGLLPATLGAQSTASDTTHFEPANYFAEFADLMHGEMDTQPDPVAAPCGNRFPAFVHYWEMMEGRAEDFLAHYKKIVVPSVPLADAVWAGTEASHPISGGGCSER